MSEPLLSQLTIECALSALRVMHDSLNEPSAHYSVEVQRAHQVEILTAIRELAHLQQEQDALAERDNWEPVPDFELYGRKNTDRFVRVVANGGILKALYGLGEKKRTMTVDLPDDIRLCRRKSPG